MKVFVIVALCIASAYAMSDLEEGKS